MTDEGQDRVVPDDERARQILEQLKGVHAFDLAYETMLGLVNFGSQKMGLLDETREVRDLGDARLSIELVRAILEVIEREQGPDRTRGLHDALAQMQLAYAHAVQLDNAERAATREAPPAADGEVPAEPEAAASEPGPTGAEPAGGGPTVEAEAAAGEVPASEPAPAAKKPSAKRPAAGKAPPRKPSAKKKTAEKKKPAAKKRPAGES